MTTPRLFDLVELHDTLHREELYTTGSVMSAAVNEPKLLRKLRPKREAGLPITGPLAIPKRKRDHD